MCRRTVCKRIAYCLIMLMSLLIAFRWQVSCRLVFNSTAFRLLLKEGYLQEPGVWCFAVHLKVICRSRIWYVKIEFYSIVTATSKTVSAKEWMTKIASGSYRRKSQECDMTSSIAPKALCWGLWNTILFAGSRSNSWPLRRPYTELYKLTLFLFWFDLLHNSNSLHRW